MAQWRIVFCIAAAVYAFCATFYNIFGSGVRQPWDNPLLDDVDASAPIQNGTSEHNGHHTNGDVVAIQNGISGTVIQETRQ